MYLWRSIIPALVYLSFNIYYILYYLSNYKLIQMNCGIFDICLYWCFGSCLPWSPLTGPNRAPVSHVPTWHCNDSDSMNLLILICYCPSTCSWTFWGEQIKQSRLGPDSKMMHIYSSFQKIWMEEQIKCDPIKVPAQGAYCNLCLFIMRRSKVTALTLMSGMNEGFFCVLFPLTIRL